MFHIIVSLRSWSIFFLSKLIVREKMTDNKSDIIYCENFTNSRYKIWCKLLTVRENQYPSWKEREREDVSELIYWTYIYIDEYTETL